MSTINAKISIERERFGYSSPDGTTIGSATSRNKELLFPISTCSSAIDLTTLANLNYRGQLDGRTLELLR